MEHSDYSSASDDDGSLAYGAGPRDLFSTERDRPVGSKPNRCAVSKQPPTQQILVSFPYTDELGTRKLTALVWTCCMHCYEHGIEKQSPTFGFLVRDDETCAEIYDKSTAGTLQYAPIFQESPAISDQVTFRNEFAPENLMYEEGITGVAVVDQIAASVIGPLVSMLYDADRVLIPSQSVEDLKRYVATDNIDSLDMYMQDYVLFSDGVNREKTYLTPPQVTSVLEFADKQRKAAWQQFTQSAAALSDDPLTNVPVDTSRALTEGERVLVVRFTNHNRRRVALVKRIATMLLNASCRYGTLGQIRAAIQCVQWVYGANYVIVGADWQQLRIHVLPHNTRLEVWEREKAVGWLYTEEVR